MLNNKNDEERKIVFTSKLVEEITSNIHNGFIPKRYQNPWFKSEIGIRRSGIVFKMTEEEQAEYIKCALDIEYFAEKYCKIKKEDGTISDFKLRDYQREIFRNFKNYRFNILMASRQIGKTVTTAIFILHYVIFNNDKNVMMVANKNDTTIEILDKMKSIYVLLPFFIKPGVKNWNTKSVIFENGCRIKTAARTKSPAIGFTIDFLYLDEFAHIPSNIIEPYYTAVYPTVTAITNSKIVITSTPNGMNLFYKLVTDAERPYGDPLKNEYKLTKVYWYQVPGRFVTYVKLNTIKLKEYNIDENSIYEQILKKWGNVTKVEIVHDNNVENVYRTTINVYNNDNCKESDIREMLVVNSEGKEIFLNSISYITTWKEETIKNIGGEDAFNQEYGLRFINSSRSVLDENLIEELSKFKRNYTNEKFDVFDKRLNFDYSDLKFVDDNELFSIQRRKEYKIIMSIDLSEGLGQDYSVINIFKISNKPIELIEKQKDTYKSIHDFFRLEQIGLYRSNVISIKQLAELLYVLVFEFFDPDNVKIVLELNNYGNILLSELPHVFDGNNNYGSYVFFRYKHKIDSNEEKIGLKVNDNKNSVLVKDYQEHMKNRNFLITNEETISEISSFVKHVTPNGNIRYAADYGHDDIVMTIVNCTTVFNKPYFKEVTQELLENINDKEFLNYVNDILNKVEYNEGLDYSQVLKIRRDKINSIKNNWNNNL